MKRQIFALAAALCCSVVLSTAQVHPKSAAETRKAVHEFAEKNKDPKQAEVSIAKQVAEMKVRLSLSDKQTSEMTKVLTNAHEARLKDAQDRREQAEKARTEAQAKYEQLQKSIDAILTPEQKVEMAKFRAEHGIKNSKGKDLKHMVRRGPQLPPSHSSCAQCGPQDKELKSKAERATRRTGKVTHPTAPQTEQTTHQQ